MRVGKRSDPIPGRPAITFPLAAWTVVVVGLSVFVWFRPHTHTVFGFYVDAGRNWTQGICSYERNGILTNQGYRYSPTVTVLYALFGPLSDAVGGIVWRWLGVALLASGFGWACRTIYPHWADSTPTDRQWLWLLLLPLCTANLYNGQANLHLIGFMLLGVAAVRSGRWNLAAICLAAACFLKIYSVSLAMLLVAIYPLRLGPRFAIALFLGAALPFLAQSPGYVLGEYRTWLYLMAMDDRFIGGRTSYRDLALLLQNIHVPITRGQFLIVGAATGAAAAAVCLLARWRLRWSDERLVSLAYALATFWMLLCGPTTESATYVLLAPLAVWLVLDAFHGRMSMPCRVLVIAGGTFVHAALFSSLFPFGGFVHDIGFQPLGALGMAIGFMIDRFGPACAIRESARKSPAWAFDTVASDTVASDTVAFDTVAWEHPR